MASALRQNLGTFNVTRSLTLIDTWGLDIAKTLSDAGGVGALLQIADHTSGKTFFPTYDGNGNVVALLNASTGALAAAYEYSPYGEFVRCETSDPVVADQPFRFSTKFYDGETGLIDFGHRFYDPKNGRFLGRDPIEEQGGMNLYGFCFNDGINHWDVLGNGLWSWICNSLGFGNEPDNPGDPMSGVTLSIGMGGGGRGSAGGSMTFVGSSGAPNSGNGTATTLLNAGATVVNATSNVVSSLINAAGTVTGVFANSAPAIANGVFQNALANGVQPIVMFDTSIAPGLMGSQSLTMDSNGNRIYSINGATGEGFLIAAGETFRIVGSPNAPSNWSIGGSGGYLGIVGIDVNMNGLQPTYISGFVGVGFGAAGKIEPPSVSKNVFQGTIDQNGNIQKQWVGGFPEP